MTGYAGTIPWHSLLTKLSKSPKRQAVPPPAPTRNRAIVIAGPTGVGKSALAMELARELKGEILSADSMQVYCGMNIGTAKPTLEERCRVRHHLLDIRCVSDGFSAVDFYYEASMACRDICRRNQVPIIVGGSGFYLHTLFYGPPEGPPSIPSVRQKTEKRCDECGVQSLYEELLQVDPDYALTISCHDRHKIIRGLEVIQITKKPVSSYSWSERSRRTDIDFRCWYLHRPRESLYRRIDERCDQMIEDGLIEEVERLLKEGLEENKTAANAIGYRQVIEYLRSESRDLTALKDVFKRATHRYAKRQQTWFKGRGEEYRWLDLDAFDQEIIQAKIVNDYRCG
ncbi:MAG: tRNA (adenosine(37)-N6)-dimethylallyltransferase MiaA [Chlamydiia bacterium]|nr:tRNA (adenosine(37)-N6)-dimethylallyltransferase MiaA [Chlamydiia bacterium]